MNMKPRRTAPRVKFNACPECGGPIREVRGIENSPYCSDSQWRLALGITTWECVRECEGMKGLYLGHINKSPKARKLQYRFHRRMDWLRYRWGIIT